MKRAIKDSYSILQSDGWWARFLSNHDKPRQVSLYGNDKEYRAQSAKMLAAITQLLPGTPFIFQGEELGMANVYYGSIDDYDDLDTKNIYNLEILKGKSGEDALHYAQSVSRDNARSPMQWSDSANAGFSEGRPWLGVNPDYKMANAASEEQNPTSVLSFYKALISLRKGSETIRRGKFEFIEENSPVLFCYRRYDDQDEYIIISDFSDHDAACSIDISGYEAVLKNYDKDYSDRITELSPYEVVVLKRL